MTGNEDKRALDSSVPVDIDMLLTGPADQLKDLRKTDHSQRKKPIGIH